MREQHTILGCRIQSANKNKRKYMRSHYFMEYDRKAQLEMIADSSKIDTGRYKLS